MNCRPRRSSGGACAPTSWHRQRKEFDCDHASPSSPRRCVPPAEYRYTADLWMGFSPRRSRPRPTARHASIGVTSSCRIDLPTSSCSASVRCLPAVVGVAIAVSWPLRERNSGHKRPRPRPPAVSANSCLKLESVFMDRNGGPHAAEVARIASRVVLPLRVSHERRRAYAYTPQEHVARVSAQRCVPHHKLLLSARGDDHCHRRPA